MKKLIFITTFLVLFTSSFSQKNSKALSLIAYWSVGDNFDFKVTKTKQQFKEGKDPEIQISEYIVNFKVIDSTETSYKIEWEYKMDLRNDFKISDELAKKLSNYEIASVIYETDEFGIYKGLVNWKEFSNLMNDIFEIMTNEISDIDSNKREKVEKAINPLRVAYSSKEGLEQYIFKELNYFHFPYGAFYELNKTNKWDEQLDNMFGGEPLKGKAQIKLSEMNIENGECILNYQMKIDPKDTKKMFNDLFTKMGLNDTEMNQFMKKAKFEISDNNVYKFDYHYGIPIYIDTERETIIIAGKDNMKRIDKIKIELLD